MNNRFIMMRSANEEDGADIQRLLHSDSRHMSIQDINACIKNFFLLFLGSKLLGVAFIENGYDQDIILWTSIHPIHSQQLLETVMVCSISGILGLRSKKTV